MQSTLYNKYIAQAADKIKASNLKIKIIMKIEGLQMFQT